MSKSRRLSIASPPCHIEWRPSRWQGAILWSLAGLAPLALLASDLPRAWAWLLALLACAWGIVDARRQRAQPRRQLLVPAGRGAATCDGTCIDGLRVGWRGSLAFLQWRDGNGRRQRAAFWPDTLDAGMRRELKVAMLRRDAARDAASMAG
jgi:toxin CptA